MKTLLYTGHNEAYKPLADITVPRMADFADHMGMDFSVYTEEDANRLGIPNSIYWVGVYGALQAFADGYERVMYLDVDQLITNVNALEDWMPACTRGFHASKDWGNDAVEPWQFSMCGFVALRSSEVLFRTVRYAEPEWRDKPFPEQGPMQWYVKQLMDELPHMRAQLPDNQPRGLINIHPRPILNAVPDQVCPGQVPEPWNPGDFAAHITMVDLPRRVEIAKEILSRL